MAVPAASRAAAAAGLRAAAPAAPRAAARLASKLGGPGGAGGGAWPRASWSAGRGGAARGIVQAETLGTVVRVDRAHWSSVMFGRERQLLMHVIRTAKEGDVEGVMAAMDGFWESTFDSAGSDSWTQRGATIDGVVKEKLPARCLEIGTYCGYSALRIARSLPEGGKLVSLEVDPLFAAIATKVVEHAGLASRVKVLMGNVEQKLSRIPGCFGPQPGDGSPPSPMAFVLCDHSKELFVPDLQLLEGAGLVGPGTVVMGDTTTYPGEEAKDGGKLFDYFKVNPKYKVPNYIGHTKDGIAISEWVHLP